MPIYLKYGDIKGDVTDSAHAGWIELLSEQWGRNTTEIVVTKATDSASSRLLNEALSGSAVDAFIDFVGDDGTVYRRLALSGALIASFFISGSGDNALENFTLNFTNIGAQNYPGTPPP